MMGGQLVEFRVDGLPPGCDRKDPRTGQPLEWLPDDGSAVVHAG